MRTVTGAGEVDWSFFFKIWRESNRIACFDSNSWMDLPGVFWPVFPGQRIRVWEMALKYLQDLHVPGFAVVSVRGQKENQENKAIFKMDREKKIQIYISENLNSYRKVRYILNLCYCNLYLVYLLTVRIIFFIQVRLTGFEVF